MRLRLGWGPILFRDKNCVFDLFFLIFTRIATILKLKVLTNICALFPHIFLENISYQSITLSSTYVLPILLTSNWFRFTTGLRLLNIFPLNSWNQWTIEIPVHQNSRGHRMNALKNMQVIENWSKFYRNRLSLRTLINARILVPSSISQIEERG